MKEKMHSPETVLEIRRLYATGDWTYKKLAERFGCGISSIFGVCNGTHYAEITGGEPVIAGKRKLLQVGHRGADHPFHKLTEEQVIEIRRLWITELRLTSREIAKRYGVCESTVSAIVNDRTWKNLPSTEEIAKNGKV